MRIGIIGAGLAGLAIGYFAKRKVTFFEANGIGSGASGVPGALLNPFMGPQGQKSKRSDEGLEASLSLIHAINKESIVQKGLYKIGDCQKSCQLYPEQISFIEKPLHAYGKVHPSYYKIHEAYSIDLPLYVQSLAACLQESGAIFCQQLWQDDFEKEFDHLFFCLGYGVKKLFPDLALKYVKGQIISMQLPLGMNSLDAPLLGQTHIIPSRDKRKIYIGGTYEHEGLDEGVNPESAIAYIKPRVAPLLEGFEKCTFLDCVHGVRVLPLQGHLPQIVQVSKKKTLLTAFGSRGLLYHALYAKEVLKNVG